MPWRVLFIDAYDSFSNNIVALLQDVVPDGYVDVIKIDDDRFFHPPYSPPIRRALSDVPAGGLVAALASRCPTPPTPQDGRSPRLKGDREDSTTGRSKSRSVFSLQNINLVAFYDFISRYDAVVAGPGPGHPSVAADVGVIPALWRQTGPAPVPVPVLGICLGFQSLAQQCGLRVAKLDEARHGLSVPIVHVGGPEGLFGGIPADGCDVIAYHSLGVRFGPTEIHNRELAFGRHSDSNQDGPFWESGRTFEPLGWDVSSAENGPVLMAMKGRAGPFWGVQYHPESVCTNESGRAVVRNWWDMAVSWNQASGRQVRPADQSADRTDEHDGAVDQPAGHRMLKQITDLESVPGLWFCSKSEWASVPLGGVSVSDLIHLLDLPGQSGEAVVLESARRRGGDAAKPARPDERDRFSVLGLVDSQSIRIFYNVATKTVEVRVGSDRVVGQAVVDDVWAYLATFMAQFKGVGWAGSDQVPFWGGLMGLVSYEAGLETLGISPCEESDRIADIAFVFVHRSVVVDHYSACAVVQSILPDDRAWVDRVSAQINGGEAVRERETTARTVDGGRVEFPNLDQYVDQINECQMLIREGESYELCLTGQVSIERKLALGRDVQVAAARSRADWDLFFHSTTVNPAPYAAFVRINRSGPADGVGLAGRGVTIVSSSPEKFLSWTRTGRCQMRPIKGTLGKWDWVRLGEVVVDEDISRFRPEEQIPIELARRYFGLNIKERAENLMIVDLIRHDLHGVSAGPVRVPGCMVVEEYDAVFQLVSVIETDLSARPGEAPKTGEPQPERVPIVAIPHSNPGRDHGGSKGGDGNSDGISVLAAALPPGSMTGAPKLRSCQILNQIESGNRGVYSGVLGFLDVGGAGHFSVVIRTAVRWDWDGCVSSDAGGNADGEAVLTDVWHVGAGGAITAKSDSTDEVDEMMLKARSTVRMFG